MRRTLAISFLLLVATCSLVAQAASGPLAGFWSGAIERDGRTWRVELTANVTESELKVFVTFVDLDVPDVPFPTKRTASGYRLERPQPNGSPIVFDGVVESDSFAGKWSGLGGDGTFSMKRGQKVAPVYREEEVTFQNGDVKLAGTLLLPLSGSKHPAVVITHGSSPNERTTYRSWGRRFAELGFAALVYDKRGSGKSTGNTRAASMENLADDALAGVRMLSSRSDIDNTKIGVMGHSQGGWIAPLAATRSKQVSFVIASGAAAVTPAEQSIYHRAGVMRSQGITEFEIEQASKLRERLYDLNRKILANEPYQADRAEISQLLIANKDARWFRPAELPPQLAGELPPRGALELLFFDPTSAWANLKVPVLVIWGDKDDVVPVEKSRVIIEHLQEKAGNKRLTIHVVPGVDHGNSIVKKDSGWDFPRTSLDYVRTVVEWAKRTVI